MMDASPRDRGLYETRYLSVGAYLAETAELVEAIARGSNPRGVGVRITAGTLLGDLSRVTRQRIWDVVCHRHFSCAPLWIARDLVEAHSAGDDATFHGLVTLHFVLRDHLTFDLVTQVLWPRWRDGTPTVSMDDGLQLIEAAEKEQVAVCRWSDDTRRRLIRSIYESLAELRVLQWRGEWQVLQPPLPGPVAVHLLHILFSEGLRGPELVSDPSWQVFLRPPTEVDELLTHLAEPMGFSLTRGESGLQFTPPSEWLQSV